MKHPITALALSAAALLALPGAALASSISLFGDKDCFGSGLACADGSSLAHWGLVSTGGSDPAPTDRRIGTASPVTWTMNFAPGTYADALVTLRAVGLADLNVPYTLFADGAAVGNILSASTNHIRVETFSFALDSALLADGSVTFSFTPAASDLFALDYVEITGRSVAAAVPVPGTLALASLALVGLALRRRGA